MMSPLLDDMVMLLLISLTEDVCVLSFLEPYACEFIEVLHMLDYIQMKCPIECISTLEYHHDGQMV